MQIKTPAQIKAMRRAGLVVADALDAVRAGAVAGARAGDLDAIAERVIRGAGAVPSFLGYDGYPASICLSINDVVVHGIPRQQIIAAGDVVSVDCGAILDGWHGDAAITFGVGPVSDADAKLIEDTRLGLWAGIAAMASARKVGDIGAAIETEVMSQGADWGILEDYVGHGIGTEMHQDPDVVNYAPRQRGPRIKPGLVLAIEPMVVAGGIATKIDADGWTVRTADGGTAAHWEHTVARTDQGIWVLTAHDGGQAELAARGVHIAPVE